MRNEFRKEYKRVLKKPESINFFNKFEDSIEVLHKERTVVSLYFDNIDFGLYKSSMLKDVNTQKLRIRNYEGEDDFFKEVKKNTYSGKYKTVSKLNINSFDEILQTTLDGQTLYPSLYTKYKRNYYTFENCRLTLDTDIKFISHKFRSQSQKNYYFPNEVLEFKLLNGNLDIEKYIDTNPVAFSKYNYAVEKLYRL